MVRKFSLFLIALAAIFSFGWLYSDSNVQILTGGGGSTIISGGGTGSVIMQNNNAVVSYADITFYDKMDSTDTGRAPTKGSGTFTTSSSNFSVGPPLSSSSTAANICNVDAQFKSTRVPASGNVNLNVGRAGFYFIWHTATNNASCVFGYGLASDVTPRFAFRKGASSNNWNFEYEDIAVSTVLTAETTSYIEVEWDTNKTNGFCAGVRQNGGSFTTSNACGGAAPSGSNIGMLGDGSGNNGWSVNGSIDEVIVSSDSQRDLYAIRNLGSYPN